MEENTMNFFEKNNLANLKSCLHPLRWKKGFRTYCAVVMSLTLVMGMAVPAFAAGTDPLGVINNLSDPPSGLIPAVGISCLVGVLFRLRSVPSEPMTPLNVPISFTLWAKGYHSLHEILTLSQADFWRMIVCRPKQVGIPQFHYRRCKLCRC